MSKCLLKKLAVSTLAVVIALTVVSCGAASESSDGEKNSKKKNSEKSGISELIEGKDLSFDEKVEKYSDLKDEYNKNVVGFKDNNTDEEREEYRQNIYNLFSQSEINEIKKAVETQCKCIRDNDANAFVESLNMDFALYYAVNFEKIDKNKIDGREEELIDYLKGSYRDEEFSSIGHFSNSVTWPDVITADDITYGDFDIRSPQNYDPNVDFDTLPKVIIASFTFNIKDSDISGKVDYYQAEDNSKYFILERVEDSYYTSLMNCNGSAKTAYNAVAEYIADEEIKGNNLQSLFENGSFNAANSGAGLDTSSPGDIGKGDQLILDVLNDSEAFCTIYVGRQEINGYESFFVQSRSKEYPNMIGQYPDPISEEDVGKVTFGEYYKP